MVSMSLFQLVYERAGDTLVFSFPWPWSRLEAMASMLLLTGEAWTLLKFLWIGATAWGKFSLNLETFHLGATHHPVPLGTDFDFVH